MTNINTELFRRTAPKKKLEMIKALSDNELLNITTTTIARIIKEAGTGKKGSPNKELRLSRENQTGNDWNSDIESWYIWKKKVYICFYIQYENTDTSSDDTYSNFISRGEYQGQLHREDRYGNPRTYYFKYDESDKTKAIRALLKEYVQTKYHDKLKEDAV